MLPRAPLFVLLLAAACNRPPSRAEALDALRRQQPGIETTTVVRRVTLDGPPWFSCAEVIAKLRGPADSLVVRDSLGNWRGLFNAGWITLRDSAAGHVVEPGWCAATLQDTISRKAGGWTRLPDGTMEGGVPRRWWRVPAGLRRVGLAGEPKSIGRDSARVEYVFSILANENGRALGANRDSVRRTAVLEKLSGGVWQVRSLDVDDLRTERSAP